CSPCLSRCCFALPAAGGTAEPSPDIDPAWSADGKYVAFARLRDEGPVDTSASVWIVGRDGRGAREITPDYEPSLFNRPAWTPDGGRSLSIVTGWTSCCAR